MKPHSTINSNLSVYLLSFFLGWASYSLKLVSIVKLLAELDFGLYPLLMLAQGISLFGSLKLMNKISEQKERIFYFIALISGLVVVFVTNTVEVNDWAKREFGWIYSFFIFMLSTFIILAIDITTRLLVTSKISMLENPKAASYVTFFGEFGVMIGAGLSLWFAQALMLLPSIVSPVVMSIPFAVSLIFLFAMVTQAHSDQSHHTDPKIDQALQLHSQSLRKHLKLYLPVLVGLISVLMLCKYFQGFAVVLGLKQWQESSSESIVTIFSLLAMAQNGLILLMVVPFFFVKGRSTVWSKGFKVLFYVQTFSMLLITIVPSPAALLGTGVLRKIIHRSLVGKSLNMLIASIPESIRFEAKSKSQKYGHSISFISLSLISYLAIYEIIPYSVVWLMGAAFAILGLYLIRLLLKKLNRFHVENILEFSRCPFNVYEAISSCYSLANKDAVNYYPLISNVISKKYSRSIFAKALIHTMGEMKNEAAINYLFDLFQIAKREDVQLEILKALNRFESLEVDNFMLNVLTKTMHEDTQRGELRTSFCEVISKRLPEPSISIATQAIEKNPEDTRIVGNAIDILGEIGQTSQTKKIRRLQLLLDGLCRNFCNYLYGVSNATEHIEFIRQLNISSNRRNSTVLLSLIRLGEDGAEIDFIRLLREASTEQALIYIKQLYRVREAKVRYSVYSAILDKYPEDVSHILHAMRDSYKNFDKDRRVIIEEAQRRGIEISDDLLYLVQ